MLREREVPRSRYFALPAAVVEVEELHQVYRTEGFDRPEVPERVEGRGDDCFEHGPGASVAAQVEELVERAAELVEVSVEERVQVCERPGDRLAEQQRGFYVCVCCVAAALCVWCSLDSEPVFCRLLGELASQAERTGLFRDWLGSLVVARLGQDRVFVSAVVDGFFVLEDVSQSDELALLGRLGEGFGRRRVFEAVGQRAESRPDALVLVCD